MATVMVQVEDALAAAAGLDRAVLVWSQEFALGETLGRLLDRMALERPGIARLYDPDSRRLPDRRGLLVNGRNHQLVGALTYLLSDGDRLTFLAGEAPGPGGLGLRD
jgi:hypothetical protein